MTVRTAVLNHPDGACGYRIDYEGCSLAYVTDTEHVPGSPDRNILDLIAGADLVIYSDLYRAGIRLQGRLGPFHLGRGHKTVPSGGRPTAGPVPP